MKTIKILAAMTLLAASSSQAATTNCKHKFEVTISNLTLAQPFSPPLLVSHKPTFGLFAPGGKASAGLTELAEAGNNKPLADSLANSPDICNVVAATKPVAPGKSIKLAIKGNENSVLSFGAMLVNSNDSFVFIRTKLEPKMEHADAHDAGTETNGEHCADIPGPACNGAGLSPNDAGEGFVYITNGIHGIGDLNAAKYDWRNPVAVIRITQIK